jgi:hypothetical protein
MDHNGVQSNKQLLALVRTRNTCDAEQEATPVA